MLEDFIQDLPVKVHAKEGGFIPLQSPVGNAGYDLYVPEGEDIHMPYNTRRKIDLGVIVQTPIPLFLLMVPRSSTGTKVGKSVRFANTLGIIDSSYQGQEDTLKVVLEREDVKREYVGTLRYVQSRTHTTVLSQAHKEFGVPMTSETECVKVGEDTYAVFTYPEDKNSTLVFEAGSRFAQIIFIPCVQAELVKAALDEFGDSRGGFGSTGKK